MLDQTIPRVQRVFSVRTRRLISATYVVLMIIIVLVLALPYLEQDNLYGFDFPRLSFTALEPSATPRSPLPRHRDYIVFEPPSHSHLSLGERPLKPASRLPKHCLESYFALGYPCSAKKDVTFDIVWTWVNGSDGRFQQAIADATTETYPETGEDGKETPSRPTSKLYRSVKYNLSVMGLTGIS